MNFDPPELFTDMGMLSRISVGLGLKLISKYSSDFCQKKFRKKQLQICKKLDLNPSDCVIFGLGSEPRYRSFNRGSNWRRVCISNLLGDMNSSKSIRESNSSSTHPSLIVRARALLHWDMIKNPTLVQIKKINQRISNDMYKFVDRGARTKLAELQNELSL